MKKLYYYKVSADTKLGKAIAAFLDVCAEADRKAQEWVQACGGREYLESPLGMAGGVSMIVPPLYNDDGTPKDYDTLLWRTISVDGVGDCLELNVPDDFNPVEAKDSPDLSLAEKMEVERYQLPVVSESQLVALLQPVPKKRRNGTFAPTVMTSTPVVFYNEKKELTPAYYIRVPFECGANGLMRITPRWFELRRSEATV